MLAAGRDDLVFVHRVGIRGRREPAPFHRIRGALPGTARSVCLRVVVFGDHIRVVGVPGGIARAVVISVGVGLFVAHRVLQSVVAAMTYRKGPGPTRAAQTVWFVRGRTGNESPEMAEVTEDPEYPDRYFLSGGRRWRRTDPALPEPLRQALVDALMDARRSVKRAKAADDDDALHDARSEVQDAKIALGERGRPWWEAPDAESLHTRASAVRRTLGRGPGNHQISPSDVARILSGGTDRTSRPVPTQASGDRGATSSDDARA